MEGKIFPDSANTWQDQAKILFNYYRQAAERVVSEEERIEQEVAKLQQEKSALEQQISGLWVWFLTIILFFVYFIKKSALEKQIQEIDGKIYGLQQQWNGIFRDYRVKRLGVAYVPVAEQVKYQDKSFIVDYTGSVPEQKISMSVSRQNDLLVDTIRNLEQLGGARGGNIRGDRDRRNGRILSVDSGNQGKRLSRFAGALAAHGGFLHG